MESLAGRGHPREDTSISYILVDGRAAGHDTPAGTIAILKTFGANDLERLRREIVA